MHMPLHRHAGHDARGHPPLVLVALLLTVAAAAVGGPVAVAR